MIASALMLVVMLMLRSMFVNAQEIYIRAARRVDVFAQGRAVLDSIERDLMKLVKGHDNETLTLRSLTPANWTNAELARQGDTYSSLEDWDITDPNQSARIQEFMSFRGVFRMWDAEQQKSVDRNASVIYYLRRRRNVSGTEEGAYLVRRLVPYYTNRELVAFGKTQDQAPQLKVDEDELASFVYSVRVFVDDQSAFRLNVRNRNNNLSVMPEASPDSPNSKWLWARPTAAAALPTTGQPTTGLMILPLPREGNRAEFGGIWSGHTSAQVRREQQFTSGRWNYPSVVMIEVTLIDRYMRRFDSTSGEGTYRTFSRAVQLPVSGPLTQLDETDINVMRQ
jgi:hypothetical protein